MLNQLKLPKLAKVIENTQRDLNISLINELSILFNKLNISYKSGFVAVSTKWNFLNFKLRVGWVIAWELTHII